MLAGPLGGMLQGQAKTFIETLKKSVREVRLTVSWQDGKKKQDVTASQIIVILPESIGAADKVQPVQQLNTQTQQNLGQVPLTPKPPSSDPGQAQ